jgi:ABC-type uncharacterized transport system substrate-binding protein
VIPNAFRMETVAGALVSHAADKTEPYRRAASGADNILHGIRAVDQPMQEAATNIELVVDLKTAKALGLPCRHRCSPAPTR